MEEKIIELTKESIESLQKLINLRDQMYEITDDMEDEAVIEMVERSPTLKELSEKFDKLWDKLSF